MLHANYLANEAKHRSVGSESAESEMSQVTVISAAPSGDRFKYDHWFFVQRGTSKSGKSLCKGDTALDVHGKQMNVLNITPHACTIFFDFTQMRGSVSLKLPQPVEFKFLVVARARQGSSARDIG